VAEFTLGEVETALFLLQEIEGGGGCGLCLSEEEATEVFKKTVEFWRRWLSKITITRIPLHLLFECTIRIRG
jgi:hypothetical protein